MFPSPTAALEKELESLVSIRFQDCDPFRHLNNARYIDYFLNAREDHLTEHYQFRLFELMETHGQGWVVTKNQIAYLAPANMTEQVLIRTRLIEATERGLVVEGQMLDAAGRQLKAVIWIEFTFFDLATGRASRHPAELLEFLQSVRVDGAFDPNGFNDRIGALRGEYRRG